MKVHSVRLKNKRCFEDTGELICSPKLNIFVGRNNTGKSTLLKAIFGLQLRSFDTNDVRPGSIGEDSFSTVVICDMSLDERLKIGVSSSLSNIRTITTYRGTPSHIPTILLLLLIREIGFFAPIGPITVSFYSRLCGKQRLLVTICL